jgi:hypothetical protein
MTTKCDTCKKDIMYYDERINKCSCGKITCSYSCNKNDIQYIQLHNKDDEERPFAPVCNNYILAHGERGNIIYHYHDNNGYGDGIAILKDPNYELMLEQLREKVAQLSVENQSLKIQIKCAPGGTEYFSAKERFDRQNY